MNPKHKSLARTLLLACGTLNAIGAAAAPSPAEIRQRMRRFHLEPAFEMDAQIPKGGAGDAVVPLAGSTDPIRAKAAIRRAFLEIEGRGPIGSNDRVENLVDNTEILRSPEEMERRGLQQSRLPESPWSDDYWPIYKGILGSRYADRKFPGSEDWKTNFDYVNSPANLAATMLAEPATSGSRSKVNLLSPSEKYDLLLGENAFPLTEAMWNQGRLYYDSNGKVEKWMGICHGWAPASFMMERPGKAVTLALPSPHEGLGITLYPSDLKGLSSLLWATGSFEQNFIGGRCDVKNPRKDPQSGRITDPGCFDTNPGTFHMAMVNQLGVSGRSLVVDVTYDYEVWNQPVVGYSYTYFNPSTGEPAASVREAAIRVSSYANDKFRRYRSKKATDVVGIAFTLEYVVETEPSHLATDSAARDVTRTATYMYDLELDEKGLIVGGEWYTNSHPDFLWTARPGSRALSSSDWAVDGLKWDGSLPLPEGLKAAARSSAQQGQPLTAIVEALVRLANP